MDKTQDAELEKGFETIEDAAMYFDDDHRVARFDDDDDLFDGYASREETEYDYEPEGAFLD